MVRSPDTNVSAIALGVIGAGIVFAWSGIKGASVARTIQDLVQGHRPAGDLAYPIGQGLASGGLAIAGESLMAGQILTEAAKLKGWCYRFGAGHGTGNPCASKCSDCSTYVCCVLTRATGKVYNMATGGLAHVGVSVPYAQRAPGDIIVWNGGTGGGHTGIIYTVEGTGGKMWNNPCTGCGGVQISKYPSGSRTALAAVVRRIGVTPVSPGIPTSA